MLLGLHICKMLMLFLIISAVQMYNFRCKNPLGPIWLTSMMFLWSTTSLITGRTSKASRPGQMISLLSHTQKQVCKCEERLTSVPSLLTRKGFSLPSLSLFFFPPGTTWVSYILDLLYFSQTAPERQTSIPIYERVPFLEMSMPLMPPG